MVILQRRNFATTEQVPAKIDTMAMAKPMIVACVSDIPQIFVWLWLDRRGALGKQKQLAEIIQYVLDHPAEANARQTDVKESD